MEYHHGSSSPITLYIHAFLHIIYINAQFTYTHTCIQENEKESYELAYLYTPIYTSLWYRIKDLTFFFNNNNDFIHWHKAINCKSRIVNWIEPPVQSWCPFLLTPEGWKARSNPGGFEFKTWRNITKYHKAFGPALYHLFQLNNNDDDDYYFPNVCETSELLEENCDKVLLMVFTKLLVSKEKWSYNRKEIKSKTWITWHSAIDHNNEDEICLICH